MELIKIITKISFIMILFIVIFDKLTRKYVNEYKMILFFGKMGCGKTTLMTKRALNYIKNTGRYVYTTEDIPGTRKFNPYQLEYKGIPEGSLVQIDEATKYFDNRNYKNFKDGWLEFFRYARQYKLKVEFYTQANDIDKKLRQLCHEYYIIENHARVFSIAKRVTKTLTVGKDDEGKGDIIDSFAIVPFLYPNSRIYTFIPRWTIYFKSFNPPFRELVPFKETPLNEVQMLSLFNYKKYFINYTLIPSVSEFVNGLSEHNPIKKIGELFRKRFKSNDTLYED